MPLLENDQNDAASQATRAAVISPTLSVLDHGIQYKATLVRLLNEDPKLSNDRLVRVRQTTRTSRSGEGEAVSEPDGKEVGLFDDVVDKKSNSFGVGNICRIRKKVIIKNIV